MINCDGWNDVLSIYPQNWNIMMAGKIKFFIFLFKNLFLTYFWPKIPIKHLKDLVKSIHNHEKRKKKNPP